MAGLGQGRYGGINHTQLTELLAEREGVMLSRPTVRRLWVRAESSSPRHRRPPRHRSRRHPLPQQGMLLQLDGSHHAWLEDRGPWLAVDDATGRCPMRYSKNRRIPEAICPRFKVSLKGGKSPWRCTLMATLSSSPGVPSRIRCWLLAEDRQPKGAGP